MVNVIFLVHSRDVRKNEKHDIEMIDGREEEKAKKTQNEEEEKRGETS